MAKVDTTARPEHDLQEHVFPPSAQDDPARVQQPNAGDSNNPVDPFGRTRDWKERPIGHKTPNTTPRSSPVKQKQIKTFSFSPHPEQRRPSNDFWKASSVIGSGDKAPLTQKETAPASLPPAAPSMSGTTIEASRSKPEALPPLLTSSLGDESVIKRAEAAVQHLSEVISDTSQKVSLWWSFYGWLLFRRLSGELNVNSFSCAGGRC
jgi:hypothetical protein